MKKRFNIFKKGLVILALSLCVFCGEKATNNTPIINAQEYTTTTQSQTIRAGSAVTIKDENLAKKLQSILNKSSFNSLDFMTHDYNGIEEGKGTLLTLDLKNAGITDIIELCQFQFPDTLEAIDLSNNKITNENLSNLVLLLNSDTTEENKTIEVDHTPENLEDEKTTYICQSNFKSLIKKVNLNNNQINLSTINNTYLNNSKLIFGIQQFGKVDKSGLVIREDMNPMYYIRSDSPGVTGDEHYLAYSISFQYSIPSQLITLKQDDPTMLFDLSEYPSAYGKMSISIASPNNIEANKNYFKDFSFSTEFLLINIELPYNSTTKEGFSVERKSLLNLNLVNGKPTAESPLVIEGIDTDNVYISYNNPSTSQITTDTHKNYVYITLKYNNHTRIIPIEFIVTDTIAPVIKLKGGNHVYSCLNKEYIEAGYKAYDPAIIGAEDGDDLTNFVKIKSNVNINAVNEIFTVTYTVADTAGNETTVTRQVEIKEAILDRIRLRTNNVDTIFEGQDISLSVAPDNDVKLSDYSQITYKWYLNGTLFNTTKTPVAEINLSDSGIYQIQVEALTTRLIDNVELQLFSNTLTINIEPQLKNNDTLILALCIALIIIIIVIIIITIIKSRRGKKKITGKHKNFHKGKKQSKEPAQRSQFDIQVIKDYNEGNNGTTGQSGSGEGGGNSNFRLPENNTNSNNDKGMF